MRTHPFNSFNLGSDTILPAMFFHADDLPVTADHLTRLKAEFSWKHEGDLNSGTHPERHIRE